MSEDEFYMRAAIAWSRRGLESGNGGIGAVVVRGGVVLGEGHNRVQLDLDVTAHGEMVAIRDGVKRTRDIDGLKGATLYTSAQPCPMCYGACKWAGITRIVYALSCADTYALGQEYGFVDMEQWAEMRGGELLEQVQVLREEALPVLEEWARLNDAL